MDLPHTSAGAAGDLVAPGYSAGAAAAMPQARDRWAAFAGLKRVVAFFCLCVVAIFAVHCAVTAGLRRIETSNFGVFNRIMSGRINSEILITGSSRALTHYDARVIERATGRSAFNIGINGSQTDMQVAVLKTYLEHNRKPRLLVHNLDSFTFEMSHGGVYFPALYLPYLDEEPVYRALTAIDGDVWWSRYVPLYGYVVEDMNFAWVQGLGGLLGWNPREDRFAGFQPRHTQWTGDFEAFKRNNPDGVRFPVEPAGVAVFEDMLRLCRDRGIPVLLVYSPVYSEMQALERNRDEVFARFRSLADQYGATLWDYSQLPMSSDRAYFYNSQHLNAEGAARFTGGLAAALARLPLLASTPAQPQPSSH